VIEALMEVLTPDGTLMMPAFSEQLSDPIQWRDFEVPDPWLDPIRRHMPPFDPRRTPTQDMGRIAEEFRTWPGVERSGHPIVSLAAWGRHKERLTAKHSLDWPLGEESPLGAFYELDGHILLLGVGHDRNSSLHLAETRATHRRTTRRRVPVHGNGGVEWLEIMDVADDLGRLFPRLGADFEATGQARLGRVGSADSRLMPQRALADFATAWFDRELSSD
jgi:aminoglycoside 3-N-acetyltransferase